MGIKLSELFGSRRRQTTGGSHVTQKDCVAAGDVVGIREEHTHSELEKVADEAYHRGFNVARSGVEDELTGAREAGYGDALKTVFDAVNERNGRAGKKQILAEIQNLMSQHRKEGPSDA